MNISSLGKLNQETKSDDGSKAEETKQRAEREENMKNAILSQALDQTALSRLSNLAAAKPEKAKQIENLIVQMARSGQIAGKMDDVTFKSLLMRISESSRPTTTVKFDRRRAAIDSDSD